MSAGVLLAHEAAGRRFRAAGVESFVLDQGAGDPVVCVHGVPTSSFLYRKVLPELASRGLRGVAFDLPGLGLAERPATFDYSWTGLGAFCRAAVDALELDRFHLVLHDIGGPVGLELAAAMPERIRSLTLLDTIVAVDRFRRPWSMQPFAVPIIGRLWLAGMSGSAFRVLMRLQGVADPHALPREESDAYVELLKAVDGGRAFLRIMRGFERTPAKARLYADTLRDAPYPIQVMWGADDPALTLERHGEEARVAAGLERVHTVKAKHFLQEDQAPAVAAQVAELARAA